MAKLTKTKSKKKTTSKKRRTTERTNRLNRIYNSLEDMLQLFSSSSAECFTDTDLVVLSGDLKEVEHHMFGILHARLAAAPVANAERAASKKTAAKRGR